MSETKKELPEKTYDVVTSGSELYEFLNGDREWLAEWLATVTQQTFSADTHCIGDPEFFRGRCFRECVFYLQGQVVPERAGPSAIINCHIHPGTQTND